MPDEKARKGPPDAILYPDSMKAGTTSRARMASVQDRLGGVLGGSAWHTDVGGGFYLATLQPHPTLLYPQDHPTRPKQPRYDWVEQDDGTRHGWLKPDEPDDDEPAPKAIKKRKAEHPPAHAEPATRPNPEENRP